MQQDDPWSLDTAPQSVRTEVAAEAPPPASLEDALLALDHKAAPVFAVLDGAQFDNVPQELMMGDFVSRPLYLDRGANNPEQIITAPHMVWLDERPVKTTGRAPRETIPALMSLIADRPAAVFWQCPAGADALYKHLRGINMVLYPKAMLPDHEEPEPAEADEAKQPVRPDTHTLVLFRHADANVIAQTLPALTAAEAARFYGSTLRLLFACDPSWADGRDWVRADRPEGLQEASRGHLILSHDSIRRMDALRLQRKRGRIAAYLRKVAPDQTGSIDNAALDAMTGRYMNEARSYGIRSEAAMGRWAYLQIVTGEQLSRNSDVHELMTAKEPGISADQRVRLLLQQSAARLRKGGV